MTSLVHPAHRDCVSSLGIPVDQLSLHDATATITRMARQRDGRSRLVSTLNVDFLVNSLGAGSKRARHPELLEVLRNSELVTADGFPILWLSRIMGKPLPERVCGSDLVPALAATASREGLSLFLLGGGNDVARRAAEKVTAISRRTPAAGVFVRARCTSLASCARRIRGGASMEILSSRRRRSGEARERSVARSLTPFGVGGR